jgi:hypothetical protein
VRMGINSGKCLAGNVGSKTRLKVSFVLSLSLFCELIVFATVYSDWRQCQSGGSFGGKKLILESSVIFIVSSLVSFFSCLSHLPLYFIDAFSSLSFVRVWASGTGAI